MPRHGPHTTPHMTNKHREAMFASGECPYCHATTITSEERQVKLRNGKWYNEAKYTCGECGAIGAFREMVPT